MDEWKTILSVREFEDYSVERVPLPEYSHTSHVECLNLCQQNLCGRYGTNWGCPPAMKVRPEELYASSDYALLVRRTFCLDVKDREVVDATALEMQRVVRMMVTALRSNGVDCMGFADGGCQYCGVCAMPDPCRFPDMFVPSISALGISMKDYMGAIGEPFSFSDDCITMYGLIFIRRSD